MELPTKDEILANGNSAMFPREFTLEELSTVPELVLMLDHEQIKHTIQDFTSIVSRLRAKTASDFIISLSQELEAAYKQQLGTPDDVIRLKLWNQITYKLWELNTYILVLKQYIPELPTKLPVDG
jgi:hypothetical protein